MCSQTEKTEVWAIRPLDIEILLHYHSRMYDYLEGDFTASEVRRTIDEFRDELHLLELDTDQVRHVGENGRTYRLTERAKVYVAALLQVPLPVPSWRMP